MAPLIWLIDKIVSLYIIAIFVRAVLSWIPGMRYRHRDLVRWLERITDPVLVPIQRLLPPSKTGGLDLSPLIAILAIQFIWRIVSSYL